MRSMNAIAAIDAGLRTFPAYAILATAYAMTNRIDEAKAAVVEALETQPQAHRQKHYRALSENSGGR